MDGHKTLVPDWQNALRKRREEGQGEQAAAIEAALQNGQKIRAIKLLKTSGLYPENQSDE